MYSIPNNEQSKALQKQPFENEERANEKLSKNRKRRLSRKEQKQLKKQKQRSKSKPKVNKTTKNTQQDDDSSLKRKHDTNLMRNISSMNENHSLKAANEIEEIRNEELVSKKMLAKNDDIDVFDYLQNYKPIEEEIQTPHSTKLENHQSELAGACLGKWFPTAKIIKPSKPKLQSETKENGGMIRQRCTILLFYQYANPQWPKETVDRLITLLVKIGHTRGLGGRIRVASEGVNATISCVGEDGFRGNIETENTNSVDKTVLHGCVQIRHFAEDLRRFDPDVFDETDFKYIDHLPTDRHFKDLKILPVQELVFYGIQEKDAPLANGGMHLSPRKYHEKLGKKDCVVIDVRNHYEAAIGRFDGQMKSNVTNKVEKKSKNTLKKPTHEGGLDFKSKKKEINEGAEYIDPLMRKSTDFTSWLEKEETQKKLKGKEVLMYCTGGVRCERASAYLKTKMGEKLGLKGVYQLQGGIEKYLKEFPDGGYWTGKNFVFDKREAISADNPNGDGGVVRKKKNKSSNNTDIDGGAQCCCCGSPWDRYVGKKKCFTCGVPVLMCDKCMSKKPDKTTGMELSVRCPICKTEGITVPAEDVEYTENGKKSKEIRRTSKLVNEGGKEDKKAASSVLKWGGGHAARKKEIRNRDRNRSHFSSE